MNCGQRVLTLVSLALGLVATGTLALAVTTDYWLFTSEPIHNSFENYNMEDIEYVLEDAPDESMYDDAYPLGDDDSLYDLYNYTDLADMEFPSSISIEIKAHSGLWRMCLYNEGYSAPNCVAINYFGQEWERIQDVDTTWSILRAIRKASPVIVFSFILMIIGFSLSTVGNARRDHKTISGAMVYVFAALCLAVGVILYISAVNDEVAHRKKPGPDGLVFSYHYGWAFFFASGSFVSALMASVANISLYLKRYPTLEDMSNIIPGLDKKHNYTFAKVSSPSDDELNFTSSCSQNNPTLIL